MARSIATKGVWTGPKTQGQLRLTPPVVLTYLTAVLGLELLLSLGLDAQPHHIRALAHWALLVATGGPLLGLVIWQQRQANQALAIGIRRDRVRALALELAGEEDANRAAELMLRHVRELTGARLAFIALPVEDGFRVESISGGPAPHLTGQRLPISPDSPGLAGQALRSHRPAVLPDTWSDEGLLSRRELALADRVRSVAAVPLVARGQVIALIGLHAETVGSLGPEEAGLLGTYAEQAAGLFESALLSASISHMDDVKQLDQLKSEFLSAVAHELRAPLTPMLGWTELLLTRTYTAEQARPMLEQIYEGARHLAVLVADLLDLSRGEAGHLSLDIQNVELSELLQQAVDRWRTQAPDHELIFITPGPLPLLADQHRIRQVVDNLLSNAIKYSPRGSRVFITARAESRQVVVRISDQGLGLTPEEREKLFAKFYRTRSAREVASGTGLGLALCKLILQAHQGQIDVESEGPNRGSAFTFRLPSGGPTAETARAGASFATVRG